MTLNLHNPDSVAHLEELKDRLVLQVAALPPSPEAEAAERRIPALVALVADMDRGRRSAGEVLEAFQASGIPGFSFCRWLVDMVDEGVYLDTRLARAA